MKLTITVKTHFEVALTPPPGIQSDEVDAFWMH
jgi:hypothetical protein